MVRQRIEYTAQSIDDKNKPLYMISVAAELAGVHPQTLRTYEQKGLVTPQRTSGGTRMYSQADIERLALINELTQEGINLAGVMRIIDLESRLDESEQKLDNLHRRCQRLARRITELDPSQTVTALIRMSDIPPVVHWLTRDDVFHNSKSKRK